MKSGYLLSDLFEASFIGEIEESLRRHTGLDFSFYSPPGERLGSSKTENPCLELTERPSSCLYDEFGKHTESVEGDFSFYCPLGLIHLGIPVRLEGRKAAWLITAGFKLKEFPPSRASMTSFAKMIPKKEYLQIFKTAKFFSETVERFIQSLLPKIEKQDKLDFLEKYSRLQESSTSLEELAQVGLEKAVSLLSAGKGIIYLAGKEDSLIPLSVIGLELEKVRSGEIAPDPAMLQKVIRSGRPVILKEAIKKSFLTKVYHQELKDAICVPLKDKDEVIGLILLSDSKEGRLYNENDVSFLMLIAAEIASELSLLRLSGVLEKRMNELSVIFKMSGFITSKFDPEEIVDSLMKMVSHLFPASVSLLKMYEKKKRKFEMNAYTGITGELAEAISHSGVADAALKKITTSGRPCLERLGPGMVAGRPSADKLLMLPLIVKEKIVGVLELYLDKNARVEEDEINLLTALLNQASVTIENSRLYKNLKIHFVKTVAALASCVEAKDPYTKGHSVRVSAFSSATAEELGLASEEIEDIQIAGILHDIGKIGISEKLLLKPGGFSDEEYSIVKQHSMASYKIVEPLGFSSRIKEAVLYHHENYSGNGYPNGLQGDKIPVGARIIRVTDSWDAMTSNRPYRNAMSRDDAIREIVKGMNRQYDDEVAKAFLKIINREDIVFETV